MTEPLPRFQRAKAALERFAPVFWLSSTSEINRTTGLVQVPTLGWRFSEPHPELKGMFTSVVRDAPRNIAWFFGERKNSLIMPSRLINESGPDGGDLRDLGTAISQRDQEFCIAASEDVELIIQAIAAQPAPPTAARLYVTQLARSSAEELLCVAESLTGEARVGMVFRAVGAPDVEVQLTALRWYPTRPETARRGPLAKVTLVGNGAGQISVKELLVSVPGR
ncbi:hypothetical protein OHB36_01980 [Streptomyces sp. NBC_00320]|uniref:hypothetical protein n=1 Tax=Streptomyces sp. NBC_00320 TaxID=2975711 RepID=UPI002258D6D3|nr:hypothetical protein [Streptomyces sp. NBC_00320]MCX5145556.1 hypothetical protein [Streptomyces sp. NBC_00320]